MSPEASARVVIPRLVAALVLFFAVAVASTYPLIWRLGTTLPGPGFGDNITSLWNVWWFRYALQHGQSPYWTPMLFAPFGTQLVLHTHATTHSILAWPLLPTTSMVAAHNAVTLLALTLNGLVTYMLARRFTGGFAAPLTAGALFAASSFVHVHLLGHTNLVHAWVLPLFALALVRFVSAPDWPRAVGLGSTAAVVVYTDYYYAVFCALMTMIWIVVDAYSIRIRWHKRAPSSFLASAILALIAVDLLVIATIGLTGGTSFEIGGQRISLRGLRNPLTLLWGLLLAWTVARYSAAVKVHRRTGAAHVSLRSAAVAATTATMLTLPVVIPAAGLVWSGGYVTQRVLWRSSPAGGDLLTMVLGHPQHALTGSATRAVYGSLGIDVVEQGLWLGLVPLLVLFGGSQVWRRQPGARPWLAIAGVFFMLALGPFLRLGGFDTALPLPQALLRYVPVLSNARIPGRAIVVTQLAVAMLLAMALANRSRSGVASAAVLALVLAEALPGRLPLAQVPTADAVDAAIRASILPGSVLELPTGIRDGFGESGGLDHRALVHQLVHQRPLVGGFVARLSPDLRAAHQADPALRRVIALSTPGGKDGSPAGRSSTSAGTEADLALLAGDLASLGVRFLIINRDTEVGSRIPLDVIVRSGFQPVIEDGSRVLYVLPAGHQ